VSKARKEYVSRSIHGSLSNLLEQLLVPASRPRIESDPPVATLRRGGVEIAQERWQIARLRELAHRGSLAAGRELIRLVIFQCVRVSSRHPDLLEPDLCDWLKDMLTRASRNPRQAIGHVVAPPRERLRPKTDAELAHAMSLDSEAYYRVRKAVDDGAPLRTILPAVAEALNALGYRNSNNQPLQASTIRHRYYAVSRLKRRLGRSSG
jgi:hypothetical protein